MEGSSYSVGCHDMQNLSDTELLDAYVTEANMPQGDTGGRTPGEAAFGELMRRHGALVYRACHRLLKDCLLYTSPSPRDS